jgi:SpoVK/Ycf46/Vps4 family AAA+-type ATPase
MTSNSKKPFSISPENIGILYADTLYRDLDYNLGASSLWSPLKVILTTFKNYGYYNYGSLTEIISEENSKIKQLPIESIKQKFEVLEIKKNSIYVLDREGRPEYEIKSNAKGEINIAFGMIDGIIGRNTYKKKRADLETFVSDIEDYKELIETTVNGIYEETDKFFSNDQEIVMYWAPQNYELEPTILNNSNLINYAIHKNKESRLKKSDSNKLEEIIKIEKPNVLFSEIGGQDKAKEELQKLSSAIKNQGLYRKWGTDYAKGILLHGPPGTGKTMLVKAVATEVNRDLYSVNTSDVTSKWYGDAEKRMQQIFDLAKKKNAILFFDEIDSLAICKEDSHEASRRILGIMQVNMDGIKRNDNFVVIGATNALNLVDPSLRRPGRFDRLVEVPLPNEEGRKQIFDIHLMKAEVIAQRILFEEGNYDCITKHQFSGADIAEIVRRTLEEKVMQEYKTKNEPSLVNEEDLKKQIEEYVSERERKRRIGMI